LIGNAQVAVFLSCAAKLAAQLIARAVEAGAPAARPARDIQNSPSRT